MVKAEVFQEKRRESGGFLGQSGGPNPLKSMEAEKRRLFFMTFKDIFIVF
ncbi:hypothetical protein MCI89_04565 [Muricomes sp. OA1]|nr:MULTISPECIES: hypothetical protein [Clostridia]MCH1971620.1 hypothetical protein [Muricomes sp. OA1]GKH34922.1 hypothetical protein CE91St64_43290 [Faecalicatena contorta]